MALNTFSESFRRLNARVFEGRGAFNFALQLQALSLAFSGVSSILGETNSSFLKVVSTITSFVAIIAGGLAVGLALVFRSLASLTQEVGTRLVNSFRATVQTFLEFDRAGVALRGTVDAFNRVVDGGVGSTGEWQGVISSLSKEFNILQSSLKEASREIISIAHQLLQNSLLLRIQVYLPTE